MIKGVTLTKLKKIFHPQGNIFHAMKKSDDGFSGFGEAYFSTIKSGEIKPWKKHTEMTLNLVVPMGKIRFVIYDDNIGSESISEFQEVVLSEENYCRLTVAPGLWMAFEGIGDETNLLLNIANIQHDPREAIRKNIDEIQYNW
jgi:dTDP-4-dehydrorhamnose 3,5-epimerase